MEAEPDDTEASEGQELLGSHITIDTVDSPHGDVSNAISTVGWVLPIPGVS